MINFLLCLSYLSLITIKTVRSFLKKKLKHIRILIYKKLVRLEFSLHVEGESKSLIKNDHSVITYPVILGSFTNINKTYAVNIPSLVGESILMVCIIVIDWS